MLGEVWGRVRGRRAGWTAATLNCGAMGAAGSMALGWILVWFSGYEASSTLTLHQYMGTGTAILAVFCAVAYWKIGERGPRWWMTGMILLTAGMVGLTGHLGGTLVHGNIFSQ